MKKKILDCIPYWGTQTKTKNNYRQHEKRTGSFPKINENPKKQQQENNKEVLLPVEEKSKIQEP